MQRGTENRLVERCWAKVDLLLECHGQPDTCKSNGEKTVQRMSVEGADNVSPDPELFRRFLLVRYAAREQERIVKIYKCLVLTTES